MFKWLEEDSIPLQYFNPLTSDVYEGLIYF